MRRFCTTHPFVRVPRPCTTTSGILSSFTPCWQARFYEHTHEESEPAAEQVHHQKDEASSRASGEVSVSASTSEEATSRKGSTELEIILPPLPSPPSTLETPAQTASESVPAAEPEATVTVTTSSLDALLSPTTVKPPARVGVVGDIESSEKETDTHDDLRASTAGTEFTEFGELEDVRLSTATDVDVVVPLDEEDDATPLTATTAHAQEHARNVSVESASSLDAIKSVRSSVPTESRRRSTSSSAESDFEYRNPLAESRDYLNEDQDDGGKRASNRMSVEGQKRLRESFMRMQQTEGYPDPNHVPASKVDWDFWGSVISDYQGFAAENPEGLARAIEQGIPDTLRGMMWQLMAASKDPDLEDSYLKLLKETSPHEKAITRDLGRTFPQHEHFMDMEGIGQGNLFNVLKAYSLYDKEVGYVQGLPFVVAILLLNMPDEEAFSLLVRLMYSYDLRGHFLPEMPKLQLRLYQFERLVEELLPVLDVHFLRQGIKASMYCSQWFWTLFSYNFPPEIVFRIYDQCLASGIEAIFRFSISLLMKNEEILLAMKFDEILAFMKGRILNPYIISPASEDGKKATYDINAIVQDAMSLKITPFMLDSYSHDYEEKMRAREAHAIEVDDLRNQVRTLNSKVKTLEDGLAQLNNEHVEVLNQLVMSRLRNEELEDELVRYKLLYAEAMHENADALSSHRLSTQTSGSGFADRKSVSSSRSK